MKKITISATLSGSGECVSIEDVKQALIELGMDLVIHFESEVNISNKTKHKETILFLGDDSTPFVKVEQVEETEGEEVYNEIYELQQGVCTRLHITYPRVDRYGIPYAVMHDDYAMGTVGEYGFTCHEKLEITSECTEDDSCIRMWFVINH